MILIKKFYKIVIISIILICAAVFATHYSKMNDDSNISMFNSENNLYSINLLSIAKDGLTDEIVSEIYKQDIIDVREITSSQHIEIWYIDADLNDDGYIDKLVIVQSPLHSGSGGNFFAVLRNNKDGTYTDLSSIILRIGKSFFEGQEEIYGELYLSEHRTNGYHDIIVKIDDNSYNDNTVILYYDSENYRFSD